MLDSLIQKDDLPSALNSRKFTPVQFFQSFKSAFKPLIESQEPLSRLSGRKLSQHFSNALIALTKQCSVELSRSLPEDWTEAVVSIMHQAILLLAKIEIHIYEDNTELLKLHNCLLTRCTEKKLVSITQYDKVIEYSSPLVKQLAYRSDRDKEFLFIKATFLITRANALLQSNPKTQDCLSEVSDLLVTQCEEVLVLLSKQPLNSFDHASIAKMYLNMFRLLFHCGRSMDSVASGDLEIHTEALEIRQQALIYFAKTKPDLTDYFSFLYVSIQATHRVAASHQSLILFNTLASAISQSIQLVDATDYKFYMDKNCCSLVEIQVFALQKLERFQDAVEALQQVIIRESVDSKAVCLQNAKFLLDNARLAHQLGNLSSSDLVQAHSWIERGLHSSDPDPKEAEKCAKRVSVEIENWMKVTHNMLNAYTMEAGESPGYSLLSALNALVTSYPKLGTPQDYGLFSYILTVLNLLLFLSSRDLAYQSASLKALNQLYELPCAKFLSNVYNVILTLLHRGEKAVAFDFMNDTVRFLEKTTEVMSSGHLCILDVWSRNLVVTVSSAFDAQNTLVRYLSKQLSLISIHDIPHDHWYRVVDINHRINRMLLESLEVLDDSWDPADLLLFQKLHNTLHCFEERVHLAERELTNCKRSLVRNSASGKSICVQMYKSQVESIVLYLASELQSGNRHELARVILEYVETVAACPNVFTNEQVLKQVLQVDVSGNSLDALAFAINKVLALEPIPEASLWKAMLLLEQIRCMEQQTAQSLWVHESVDQLYISAVVSLQTALQGWANMFQCPLDFSPCVYNLLKKKRKPELSQLEVYETIRSLVLCADVCALLKLHKMTAIAFELAKKMMRLLENSPEIEARKMCIKLRFALALYSQGFASLASDVSKIAMVFEPEFKETHAQTDDECTQMWVSVFQAERLFYASEFLGCIRKCESVLQAVTPNGAFNRREQLLKAYCSYLLSKVYLLQGNYPKSQILCNEGRKHLQESSSVTVTLQNLSLLTSIKDNTHLKLRDREPGNSVSRSVVFPWSSWCVQDLSARLLLHLADVNLAKGLITTTAGLLSQGVKLGRVIGAVSLALEFATLKVNLERQSISDPRLDCANISQEECNTPLAAKDFLTAASRSLFGTFLPTAKSYLTPSCLTAAETIHFSDEALLVLSPADVTALGHFISGFVLVQALITIGDLTVTQEFAEMLEPLRLSDQNFYKIARAAMTPQFQGVHYQALRSLLHKRQASMLAKKKKPKECIGLLTRSILELGCCEEFLDALASGKKCCSAFELNPHLMNELASSAVIYADLMIKHDLQDEGYGVLRELGSVIGVRCISAQRQIGYLLARNPESEPWTKAYFAMKSIGVSYSLQMQCKGVSPALQHIDSFVSTCQNLEKDWSVVGLTIGRGVLSEGMVLARISPGKDPYVFTLSSRCSLCSVERALPELLEDFAKVMRESSTTISSKLSSNKWWQVRESLNERLENWLENVQSKLFGPLSCLLLGKLEDEGIERLIETEAKELTDSRRCTECGQLWSGSLLYYLLSAVATDSISNEDIKRILDLSGHNKALVMKKVRIVRKEVGGRTLSRHPVVLVLDGSLLYLPWESLPIFSNQAVTRLPAFQFLVERLRMSDWTPESGFYILNPSKDLDNTQATFQPFLTSKQTWTGVTASAPTESEFKASLETKDLVLYCGHSSGEHYIRGDTVKDLQVKAVTLLIGCSSGMLRPMGQYEPQGIAAQYLIGGCPALVANLWDVTDKDIDRFAMELLKRLCEGEELSSAVSRSRHVCKLKYLIGAAPVVYGVPMKQRVKS